MHPETRRLIKELSQDGRDMPDPIEEAIRLVGVRAPLVTDSVREEAREGLSGNEDSHK